MVHGNLGVSSELKEREDDAFAQALALHAADPERSSRPVDIAVDYDGTSCSWSITDQGPGFDVARVLERCLSDDPEVQLASGRGILMMHSFLDDVRYELGGRRVVLTLRRPVPERRQDPRTPLHLPLQVAPVHPDGTPDLAAAFAAVARDLSSGGMALWQEGMVTSERVVIGIPQGETVRYYPAEVRHCRPLGDGTMELGCRFLPAPRPADVPRQLQDAQEAVAALLEERQAKAPAGPERRAHPRVACNERIEIVVDGRAEPIAGFARDLSRGGIAFITRTSLPSEVTIGFAGTGAAPPLRVRAQVVRCVKVTEGFYEVGARFARLERPSTDEGS